MEDRTGIDLFAGKHAKLTTIREPFLRRPVQGIDPDPSVRRRDVIRMLAALAAAQLPLSSARSATSVPRLLGPAQPFDYAWLKGQARARAVAEHERPATPLPDAVGALDWDRYQALRYRADHALWAGGGSRFQARFFHLGLYFREPVRIFEVVDGRSRELAYDPAMFD